MSPERDSDEWLGAAAYDPDLDIAVLRRRRERVLTFLALLLVGGLSLGLCYYVIRPLPVDQRAIQAAAEQAVREAIGVDLVFRFGDNAPVSPVDDDTYLVRNEVLVLTQEGASRRYWFDCEVHRASDGSWAPAKLTLLPE